MEGNSKVVCKGYSMCEMQFTCINSMLRCLHKHLTFVSFTSVHTPVLSIAWLIC
jgi:hypothetical protein